MPLNRQNLVSTVDVQYLVDEIQALYPDKISSKYELFEFLVNELFEPAFTSRENFSGGFELS